MNLLMVAADPMELGPLAGRCSGAARIRLNVDWACRGRLNGHTALLIANGAGSKRAGAAVREACGVFAAEAIVSAGFCGALDPSLGIGEVVAGAAVEHGGRRYAVEYPAEAPAHRTGVVCTLDHVAHTASEKRALRAAGGDVVEMEAAGVAAEAASLGVPFYCIRVVTDLASESFSNDFNAALREDGHFDTMRILRFTLRRPAVRLPELLRLRHRCARAARILGEFIAECRF